MKTFEQCCDEVAKKLGAKSFNAGEKFPKSFYTERYKQAAILHAREKVKEALKIARPNMVRCFAKEQELLSETEILKQLGL